MAERPLCPTCGAYWDCGHPYMFLAGIPVYVDEQAEWPMSIHHRGPTTFEWTQRVNEALKVLGITSRLALTKLRNYSEQTTREGRVAKA